MFDSQSLLVALCGFVAGLTLRPVLTFFINLLPSHFHRMGAAYYPLLLISAFLGMFAWSALLVGMTMLLDIAPLQTERLTFVISFILGALVTWSWLKRRRTTA